MPKLADWIIGISVSSLFSIIISFVYKLALVFIKGKGKEKEMGEVERSGPTIFSALIKKAADLAFLENEDALISLEIIGKGGCGVVYKAELPQSDNTMFAIAIKKITTVNDQNGLALEQMNSEITTVGLIRHRNILPLLAHIPRPDCHYLVYEYMKNGSLHDMLKKFDRGEMEFDWLSRYKIAVGIANGLEYIHTSNNPRIIHRDLKPANILLDDDMEAKITDFGLAITMFDAQTHATVDHVAGTVGYKAPEYNQLRRGSDKSDIYSFGIILGVLVIGKFPDTAFFADKGGLGEWIKNLMMSGNLKDAIDARLIGNHYEEQMLLVLKIACICTMDYPMRRPESKDVRIMLKNIKH